MARNKETTYTNGDVSILSNGMKLEGKITSEGNVRIDGIVVGDIVINGNLTLGDTSSVEGNIKANSITVNGSVKGKIDAGEKLVLESKSKIYADLTAKTLIVQEGAMFEGKSVMNNGRREPVAKKEG